MTDQALAQATYQYIKEFEGFIGQVHYDSKGIPTLGAGFGAASAATTDMTIEELNIIDNVVAGSYKNVA